MSETEEDRPTSREDCVLVPREPSLEMIVAGGEALLQYVGAHPGDSLHGTNNCAQDVWDAMIAASPSLSAPTPEGVREIVERLEKRQKPTTGFAYGSVYSLGEYTAAMHAEDVEAASLITALANDAARANADRDAAIDEITALAGRVAELEEALKPFAADAESWTEMGDTRPIENDGISKLTVADLRRARSVLPSPDNKEG